MALFYLLLSQKSVSVFFSEITGASNLELKKPRKLTRFYGISHPMTDSHGYIYRSMNFVAFYGVHVAKYTIPPMGIQSVMGHEKNTKRTEETHEEKTGRFDRNPPSLVHSKVGWLVGDLQVYGCFQKYGENTPNHPFVHRVFHEINHPFWWFSPYFWKHPYGNKKGHGD